MILKLKILLVAAFAFHMSLVFFNNITDYGVNFVFVQHTLSMDTVEGSSNNWRAINNEIIQHFFYIAIILWEFCISVLCWRGAWQSWRNVANSGFIDQTSKNTVSLGLIMGMLLWLVAFISVGGEWFLMWLSQGWNETGTAFSLFAVNGIILIIYLIPVDTNNKEI